MHNNIMAAGSKERPPMLGPGRYSQWHSRFLRYLDTKSNGEYLRKCIFDGPYMPTNVLIAAVEAAENILPVAAHEEVETIHNMTAENKLYYQAEKEAIFLILTGIGDEIYSTVDACSTAKEMWTAIERLQQGESLNVQDVKTNLFWEFGKFTSRDGESMESYYSRFYKLMNGLTRNILQVSPMQRYAKELGTTLAKYFKKLYKPTNNNLRTSSNSKNKTEDTTPSAKDWDTVHLTARDLDTMQGMHESKSRIKDYANHKEKMIIANKQNKVPRYIAKFQKSPPDESSSYKSALEQIPYDTSDPANRFAPDGEEIVTLTEESRSKLDKDTVKAYNYTYQNSLYETFKPPSKANMINLERAKEIRKTMWRKTFVRTKPNIAKNIGFLPMSKSISKSRLLYNEMTNNFNHFRTICQQTWSNHTSSAFPNPTPKSMEVLIKRLLMPLSDKTILDSHCFIHELKKEMNDDLEYVNSLEKELDELESEKADFSNIYDLLLEECVSKDVTCSYLHSMSDLNAHTELKCMYLHKVKVSLLFLSLNNSIFLSHF
ncbi:hypothetical protein Tco_0775953 [Tanacetum coccineum]